jgi:O-antigen ligase
VPDRTDFVYKLFVVLVFVMPFDTIRGALLGAAGPISPFVVVLMLGLLLCARPARFIGGLPAACGWFVAYAALYGCWVALAGADEEIARWQLYRWLVLVAMIALFAVSHAALRHERLPGRALFAFAVSCAIVSTLVLLGVGNVQLGADMAGRVFGESSGPNSFAALLALGVVCSLSYAFRPTTSGPVRVMALLVVLPQAVAIVYTGSRGGLVAALAGILALLPLRLRWDRKTLGRLVAFAFAFALLLTASDRVAVTHDRWRATLESGSMAGRERIYPAAIDMFLERPLLGWGPYVSLRELSRRLAYPALLRDTHNNLLWVATESGLVGLVIFGSGVWLCIRAAIAARRTRHDNLAIALLACSLVASMSCTNILSPEFWLVLAYAMASDPRHRRASRSPFEGSARAVRVQARLAGRGS